MGAGSVFVSHLAERGKRFLLLPDTCHPWQWLSRRISFKSFFFLQQNNVGKALDDR